MDGKWRGSRRHNNEERDEHDVDVCATDHPDLWVGPLMDAFFRSQEWQEGGRHGQSNVQGLHDDEERDKHDADVCVADNLDLSVRLFTNAILCQGWKGDKKVEDMVTDMYTVFMMTKNVTSMMLMFVLLTIQISELG